jgi:hypothetical protein
LLYGTIDNQSAGTENGPPSLEARSDTPVGQDVTLSIRIPGTSSFALHSIRRQTTDSASGLREQHGIEMLPLDSKERGCDHAEFYRERQDAGAVLKGPLLWMTALDRLGEQLPAVFDEQVRQLGPRVTRLDGMPGEYTTARKRSIRSGNNAFFCGDGAVCLGTTMERLVLNAELLEKCAQAFVLARLAGCAVRRIPWFVRFVAGRRLQRDERRAAEAFARGESPRGITAY